MPGTTIQKDNILEAYEDVRDDKTETNWLFCTYEGDEIVLNNKGCDYEELVDQMKEADRAFAFVRVIMGDELSKRAKFALITWTGENAGVLNKARMSTDKSLIKNVIKSFAVEINATEAGELMYEVIQETLQKAGGANYGTGVRD